MGKLLSLDFGLRRIGVAISDENQKYAFIRPIIIVDNWPSVINEINKICIDERVASIIIGWPKPLNGKEADLPKELRQFIDRLKQTCHHPIFLEDERLTSKLAQRFINTGSKTGQKKSKGKKDQLAAQILLQNYIDRKNNGY